MDYNSDIHVYQNKENMRRRKVRKEFVNANSPARTPLLNMRNTIPSSGYVQNIRKTLYGTPTSSKKKTIFGTMGTDSTDSSPTGNSRNDVAQVDGSRVVKMVSFAMDSMDDVSTFQQEEACHTSRELDQEIEVFINSILKLTTEEIRKEKEMSPTTFVKTTEVEDYQSGLNTRSMQTPLKQTPLGSTQESQTTSLRSPFLQELLTRADRCSKVNQAVMVKPSCVDRITMTDVFTRSIETAMTPIKLSAKSGKRLTVDEIRRQHPRVLANHIQTTQDSNEKLRLEVGHVEKERNKLKCIIKDLRASLALKDRLMSEADSQKESEKSQLEEMHFSIVRDFQTQSEDKVDRINSLQDEVYSLKTMLIESETGYHCFKTTLEQRCVELQAKLDLQEETHLNQVSEMHKYFEDNNYKCEYERSQRTVEELQSQLDEFTHILADIKQGDGSSVGDTDGGVRYNDEMRNKLIHEYVSMQRVKKDMLNDLTLFRQENVELKNECKSLTSSLGITLENMAQLQAINVNTCNDLQCVTSQVGQLNSELAGARKVIQDLALSKHVLLSHLQELGDKESDREDRISSLRARLARVECNLAEEEAAREDWERIATEGKTALQDVTSEYELSITNLQRTLESRDLDIDFLEKDLYECREIIQEQRQKMDATEKQHKAFRANVHIQIQDQTDFTIMKNNVEFLEAERGMLLDTLREMDEKVRANFVLERQHSDDLSEAQEQLVYYQNCIQDLKEELSGCRMEIGCTQMMLLKEREESEESLENLIQLEDKMRTILSKLKRKVGLEEEDCQEVERHMHTPPRMRLSGGDTSLLSSGSCPQGATPVSPGEVGQNKLGLSRSSAFSPVISRAASPELTIVKKMEEIGDILSDIIRMAHILEEASQLSLQDVKGENELLTQKVTGLENEVRTLHGERIFHNTELTDSNQLIENLKGRIREMGERIISLSDDHIDNKLLHQEVDRLHSLVKHAHSERDVLAHQLDEMTLEVTGDVPISSKHDVAALQRKNLQLILETSREKDRYQELEIKAERKMKYLESNWKKAESEVVRFDELMESIHNIMKRNSNFISHNPELQQLLHVINGE